MILGTCVKLGPTSLDQARPKSCERSDQLADACGALVSLSFPQGELIDRAR